MYVIDAQTSKIEDIIDNAIILVNVLDENILCLSKHNQQIFLCSSKFILQSSIEPKKYKDYKDNQKNCDFKIKLGYGLYKSRCYKEQIVSVYNHGQTMQKPNYLRNLITLVTITMDECCRARE